MQVYIKYKERVFMRKTALFYILKKRGLTQTKLAKELKMSRTALNFIINNKRPPTSYQVRQLVNYFQMDESELLKREV